MIQYVLTGLAGLVCGVVLMRLLAKAPDSEGTNAADAQVLADKAGDDPTRPASTRTMLIAAGALVAVGGVAFLVKRDAPQEAAGQPSTAASVPTSSLDDVDTMISKLEARLANAPGDGEGFRMLGWSYANTGKPDRALEPYRKAIALLPKRADVLTGYGEALVAVAKGSVTPEAKAQFDLALAINPAEPRALYFKALHKAQNGQEKAALDDLITLANQGTASAPWQPEVRQEIKRLASKLRIDVSSRISPESTVADTEGAGRIAAPDPAAAAVMSALPEASRSAAINGMVEGLANKLKADPGNAEGWAKLLRSRMVLGDTAQAQSDLAAARSALKGQPEGLKMINDTARKLAIPGA